MMTVTALLGYLGFLVAAFGVRSLIHRRRTGSSGWLAPPTGAARLGDGLFTVGVAATMTAPVLELVGLLEPLDVVHRPALGLAGLVLLVSNATVALVAQAQMGAAWRAGIDVASRDHLVRTGLFSVVRNPFYLGVLVASLGVALVVPSVAALGGWLAVLLGSEIDVRLVEEPHLRAVHGETYGAYQRSVPRFVPLLRPRAGRWR